MIFFAKITAISMTLKGIITLVVLAAIGIGGYFVYTEIIGVGKKVKEVAEDTGEFLAGRPTRYGAALGEKCNVGADCRGFTSALSKEGGVACCQNKCSNTKKDFMSVWWCPHECRSGMFAA